MTIFDPNHANSLKNGVICSPQDQKCIIKELNDQAESNLKEGNLYYVVSSKWFIGWQRYTGQDDDCEMNGSSPDLSNGVDKPGPIDNSDLTSNMNEGDDDEIEIIRTLEEGRDYVLVPEEVWKKLFEWYNGGPPLARKLISQGAFNKKFNVEVYPLSLKLTDSSDKSQSNIRLSKKASIRELYEEVCTLKGISQDKVQIWDYFNEQKAGLLAPSEKTLEDANLQMDQHILLEVQTSGKVSSGTGTISPGNELALIPMEPSKSSVMIAGGTAFSNGYATRYNSDMCPGLSSSSSVENGGNDSIDSLRKKETGGLAGLQNLGNTCFMNSALQCLVHTAPLVEYFLHDYSDEINKQNPLGMHGELATAFGDLLREIWSSGWSTVAPRVFKGKLARFAPQFSGYNQHDSQELLAFLLDGLHEDLNRVKQKPYIEMKDSDGRPDEEYAEECWKNHKARNDSIIVDICQGQYKSTLVCPVCSKISITFDPFMYLSLPLPSSVNRMMTITVLYGNGSGLPMPYTVTVSKHGSCRDLIQALGTACCLKNDESLLLAEVYNHKIYRYLDIALEPLASIKDDDHIVAYRVPKKQPGLKKLEILHQSPEKKLIGSPLVTYLQEEPQTVGDLCISITSILSPLRKACVSSSRNHSEKENGCASGVNDEGDNGIMDNTPECIHGSDFSFQLRVTDRFSGTKHIDDDYVKSSTCLKVTLDWTDHEHELYDISYLEDLPEVYKSGFSAKKTRQEGVSLFSCLDAFLKEEPLGLNDMWYCPKCKEHRQASKKLDLWRLPEILVIHLKRFSYSRYLKNKLDTFVSFPIQNLDLGKYANCKDASDVPYIYELYAISNHYGSLGGGHYSAYAKLIDKDKWYHFDDSHVSPVNEPDIKTSAAYVLFYRRVKTQAK